MKIMHLISGGDAGGAKTHVISLLEELSKRNEVELVCFVEGPFAQEAREKGINTRILKKRSLPHVARNLKKYLKNKQFDILHCHGAKANVASMLMGRASCPILSTIHSDPRLDYMSRPVANWTIGLMNRVALRIRDGWVAVSDAMKERMAGRGYDAGRMQVIYNGVAFPKKLVCKPRQEYLESLGLDWNESNVIYGIAARIDPVKDMTTLVKAFSETVKAAPNARLLIAGIGDQEQEIKELAQKLCPPGTVHFAGWVGDMNSFYHALDVNMLTSISETFSYAITEGARMHCATICTPVGGLPKVVIDGQTGYLVAVGDHETMASRMIALARDPGLRAKLGSAIYEKVKSEFSVESMTVQQEAIYRTVLNRRERAAKAPYGAVICGAYGKGNAGDDAILVSMIRQLRQQDPDLPITVMTRKPRQTAVQTGVSTVHIFNILAAGRIMKKSRLYISGGGSLIQNATSTRSLWYYLYSIRQAKRAGCKVMMYGCGIGPVSGERIQAKTGRILDECVDLITLRDRESLETLRSFGVQKPRVCVTADPALLMEGDTAAAERYLQQSGLNPEGHYSLFVLRPWDGTQEKLAAISAAADYGWEKYGLAPLFYTLEPDRDEEITRTAAAMVKAPCQVLKPVSDGATLCGLMGMMDVVVSMRLHALVFACARQTPVAAISYDPKVSGFMSYLGSDCCVELERVSEAGLKTLLDRAMTQDTPHQVDRLKLLSGENGVLAGELLRS